MRFKAFVRVSLKHGYSDPEGEATANALRGLGYPVSGVRVGKTYEVVLEAEDEERAASMVDEMCRRLLTNPVKDDYVFEISEWDE
ncbi:MAG TPA: phosphoribosylformylglycinamidine synthase, purS protein [Candidatus Bathyarchaeota archaeon]|nr:phosphoribosylformylglycinamidine synthase, purS protein [Candidatus Bathyarchaeota archaeon]